MEAFSYAYAIPYLAIFLVFVVLLFWEFRQLNAGKEPQYIRWIAIIVFLIFFGLRGYVYTDWAIYAPLFEKLPTIGEGGLSKVLSTDFSEEFLTDVSVGFSETIFKILCPKHYSFHGLWRILPRIQFITQHQVDSAFFGFIKISSGETVSPIRLDKCFRFLFSLQCDSFFSTLFHIE